MTKRKIDQLTELPPELVIWVNAETAAAMRLTQNWQPDEVLTFAINGANEQALLEV